MEGENILEVITFHIPGKSEEGGWDFKDNDDNNDDGDDGYVDDGDDVDNDNENDNHTIAL